MNGETKGESTGEFCLLDLTNSKGNGFHLYSYDGIYVIPMPIMLLKGEPLLEKIKKLKDVEMKDDDIIICAYPKCGTHWVWEVLEMLKSGVVKYQNKVKETRMIEFVFKEGMDAIPAPRIFNSHYPLRMLPKQIEEKNIKCVQIMRNPKDTCVSFYHHFRNMQPPVEYKGDFAEFTESFLEGKGEKKIKCVQIMRNPKDICVSFYHHLRNMPLPVEYKGDFAEFTESFLEGKVPFGSYHGYIKSWNKDVSEMGDLPVVTLFYEDMKKDPVKCIKQLAEFLKAPVSDKFCEDIAEACSFKKMKKADETKEGLPFEPWKDGSEGTFYRKGEVGDWKNWFTVAESERFDQIWNEKMKDSGITFTYSLV